MLTHARANQFAMQLAYDMKKANIKPSPSPTAGVKAEKWC
jgi:hypothetical protein